MMVWYFTSLSTLFKSYQDNERVIIKKALCNEMPNSHELNSVSSVIQSTKRYKQSHPHISENAGSHFHHMINDYQVLSNSSR